MTINRTTLSTLAVVGSLMLSVPAFANNDSREDRSNGGEVIQNTYSGSEDTMTPAEPSTSYEEPAMPVHRDQDHLKF